VQPVISAKQAREIDSLTTSKHHIPSIELMQAAAEACFREISAQFGNNLNKRQIWVLCGRGNNGGDGAALALLLANAGAHVNVILFGSVAETKGDARTNFDLVQQQSQTCATLTFAECSDAERWKEFYGQPLGYDVIVDALFGTGLSRPLEGLFAEVVKSLVRLKAIRTGKKPLIVSVDLPSGLNADSATPIGAAVQADVTVTFTAPKPANVLPPAAHANGRLVVADIRQPPSLLEEQKPQLFVTGADDARRWLISTRYTPDSYKNSHGHVLVIAGSRGFTGAAVLSGNAAMRSGAGLVTIATPASAQASVAAGAMPEIMTAALAETDRGAVTDGAVEHAMKLAEKASVIAIGPGLTADDERTRQFVFSLVNRRRVPVVIDADGLNCLARFTDNGWPGELQGSTAAPLVLTPHVGEMLRLLGTNDKAALEDRVAVTRDFSRNHNVIVVLKGTRSLIGAPDGRVFINPTGNAGLGTAGAGDTLTGIIAGFMAQARETLGAEFDPLLATIAALYVGGLAGDFAAREIGMRAMVASDIREHISAAIKSLDAAGEMP
jgi:NAD(P)H-hydrate epimerase